jgi:hypothetical protein
MLQQNKLIRRNTDLSVATFPRFATSQAYLLRCRLIRRNVDLSVAMQACLAQHKAALP